MSSQNSANLVETHDNKMLKENRHLADFNPNFWGDIFLSSPAKMEELKQQVRRMLVISTDKPYQNLDIIDAIQRLGVAYHFEKEIEDALHIIYHRHCNNAQIDDDLYTASVRFRLLRKHGFNVSCEEALAFTMFHLKLAETTMDYPLSTQIANALKRPLRKSLPRLVGRSYIPIYEGYATLDKNLMKFAKLDFNMVQHLHKEELSKINRWWKCLDIATNFPFIRDRLVECYFWILGVYFEPHYTTARTFMTKVISLTSILDDIYDAYGTYEELEIFTEAIQRWDINCIDQLPDYMRVWYSEVLNVYKEMEDLMSKEGKSYRVQFAIKAMKQQSQVYHAEAKWLHENYTPTMEEYMPIALVSCGYPLLTIASFVGMDDSITKETFIWAFNDPKICRASNTICRLMSDIVSHKFEQERGHVSSAVECYMKQHGVSMQEAYNEFYKQTNNAWKDINVECLKPTAAAPRSALNRILNLARVMDLFHKGEDAYTRVGDAAKTSINALLIDSIPI
ncbi:hypothetical protein CXB51_029770 [Gossypium anomalum]|uniref:(+)-delta-cadinene synthase n=1 Tax=Gossypium anomalum TaxID=47600 RepID=A0A8J5YBM0_9ROSI|nr:hypothetical protein CXB51_029770 [Gossypium anomalum]